MDGTGSVLTNTNMQAHKKFYAFEDATNKNASLQTIIPLVAIYFLALVATIIFPLYIQAIFKEKNIQFESTNDILTDAFEHQY